VYVVPPVMPDPTTLKPILKGIWQGGTTYTIDTVSGKLATSFTPPETRKEIAIQSVHSILYWLDKDDPLGPPPSNPAADSQFERWETPVRKWALENGYSDQTNTVVPAVLDDVHTGASSYQVIIQNVDPNRTYGLEETVSVFVSSTGKYQTAKASLYVNDMFVQTIERGPYLFRFNPKDISRIRERNTIKVVGFDTVYNRGEANTEFKVALDG
jgi:hypothetical protein